MGFSGSWQFTLLVVILLILRASTETSPSVKKGLIVIPGLGRIDRLETVVHNLKLLKSQRDNRAGGMVWDCIVYIYAAREVTSFWSESEHLKFLYSECQIVEVANKRVTENLYMVQPAFVSQLYENVVLFLDDCKIEDSRSFDLSRILRIMKLNNLTVASPMIVGANKGGGQKFRNIMQTPALPNSEGYISNFVEIFVWVMTMPAYTALWELFAPAVNPYAWGYDFWYDGYAFYKNPHHRMGIIATQRILHVQNPNDPILGRTDTTDVKVKWNAVLAQERHYKHYLGVNLQKYRINLRISNTSWNGAVQSLIPLLV